MLTQTGFYLAGQGGQTNKKAVRNFMQVKNQVIYKLKNNTKQHTTAVASISGSECRTG